MKLECNEFWQTQTRGTDDDEYQIYLWTFESVWLSRPEKNSLACADDGEGGDTTRPDKPPKTYDEWLES